MVTGWPKDCHPGMHSDELYGIELLTPLAGPCKTTESYLVLITVEYNLDEPPYQSPALAPSAQRHFLPGPGEALPFQSVSLRLEGVIRIEGHLLRCVFLFLLGCMCSGSLPCCLVYLLATDTSSIPPKSHHPYSAFHGLSFRMKARPPLRTRMTTTTTRGF